MTYLFDAVIRTIIAFSYFSKILKDTAYSTQAMLA
jgi:hypothetical protein